MLNTLELNPRRCSVTGRWQRRLCALAIAALTVGLTAVVITANSAPPTVAVLAYDNLLASGVENPVTAVLLNYRSYDTLLEIAVLLVAALAVLPTVPTEGQYYRLSFQRTPPVGPILQHFLSWLVPLTLITSGYLLWTGAYAPGGAFQAGTLLAAAGVLLALADSQRFYLTALAARWLLVSGLWVFVGVAIIMPVLGNSVLQYPNDSASSWILLIESTATVSIAGILWLLFYQVASTKATTLQAIALPESDKP